MNHLRRLLLLLIAPIAVLLVAMPAAADDATMHADVMRIARQWAHIRYEVHDRSAQFAALQQLEPLAGQVVTRYPGQAEPLLWQGIVVSEEAARASMLRQMGFAKRARDILQHAYRIDPHVARGGAALSLGVLYDKVPGFPIGFGSSNRARELFREALSQDPNGLDVNFFYGDFLASHGDRAGARTHLTRALRAPHDPDRPVWDAGRRAEARDALAKL